jgi:hypothetical protein
MRDVLGMLLTVCEASGVDDLTQLYGWEPADGFVVDGGGRPVWLK